MKMVAAFTLIALAAAGDYAHAQRRGDQVEAFEARRQGRLMPLREIERRIVPRMNGAQYLGVELDDGIYTFKFLRDGNVVWLFVDGRSGQILRQMGQ